MKEDTKALLCQITNPKLMLSKVGAISANHLIPIIEGKHSVKKNMTISNEEELPKLIKYNEGPLSIFEENISLKSKQKKHKKNISYKISNTKSTQVKSRNVNDTSDYFYFPTDHHKYPNSNAYYSFSIKHNTSRIPKEENSYHYYINHDIDPLYKIHGIVNFSKMTSERKSLYNDTSQSYRRDYQTIDVVKTEEDSHLSHDYNNNNKKKNGYKLSYNTYKSNKPFIPRTLEYNPKYDIVHPRLKTFVNYSPQKTEINKTLRDQGNSYESFKSYNTHQIENKGYQFDQMKGRIKDGIQQKYPSYMYCLYNKFGLEQPNDVALKMNSYTNNGDHTLTVNNITQRSYRKDMNSNDNDLLKDHYIL